jgi:hypothetical protein
MTNYSEQTKKAANEIINYWLSNVSLKNIRFITHNGYMKKFGTREGLYRSLCWAIENDREWDIVEA